MFISFFFIWFICAIAGAIIGNKKGEGVAGFLIGMLLGPFGLILILASKGNRKECPYCKELIHKKAIRCPYCQKEFS